MQIITSEQVRAARALLRWEQKNLSENSGVSLPTVKRLETQRGKLNAFQSSITALTNAFETAGIEFLSAGEASETGGAGVRLRQEHNTSHAQDHKPV